MKYSIDIQERKESQWIAKVVGIGKYCSSWIFFVNELSVKVAEDSRGDTIEKIVEDDTWILLY